MKTCVYKKEIIHERSDSVRFNNFFLPIDSRVLSASILDALIERLRLSAGHLICDVR